MDLRIVWTITTLLLTTAEADQTPNATKTQVTTQPNSTTTNCSCPSASPAAPTDPSSKPSSLTVGLLTISWTTRCTGDVNLTVFSQPSLPVCHGNETAIIKSLLTDVCVNKKGCTGPLGWPKDRDTSNGYDITKGEANGRGSICKKLTVRCKVEDLPDVQGQLRPYKVAIALLCCVLLAVILIRFTRPTIKALQKRLSERRENRWVGPTQSHSVSYHRGKSAVKTNDGEKRFSYPALERLAVSDSREPSSNRNSDYNF